MENPENNKLFLIIGPDDSGKHTLKSSIKEINSNKLVLNHNGQNIYFDIQINKFDVVEQADVILLLFDLTREESLEELLDDYHSRLLKRNLKKSCIKFLIGNKLDLAEDEDYRDISTKQIEQTGKGLNIEHCGEISVEEKMNLNFITNTLKKNIENILEPVSKGLEKSQSKKQLSHKNSETELRSRNISAKSQTINDDTKRSRKSSRIDQQAMQLISDTIQENVDDAQQYVQSLDDPVTRKPTFSFQNQNSEQKQQQGEKKKDCDNKENQEIMRNILEKFNSGKQAQSQLYEQPRLQQQESDNKEPRFSNQKPVFKIATSEFIDDGLSPPKRNSSAMKQLDSFLILQKVQSNKKSVDHSPVSKDQQMIENIKQQENKNQQRKKSLIEIKQDKAKELGERLIMESQKLDKNSNTNNVFVSDYDEQDKEIVQPSILAQNQNPNVIKTQQESKLSTTGYYMSKEQDPKLTKSQKVKKNKNNKSNDGSSRNSSNDDNNKFIQQQQYQQQKGQIYSSIKQQQDNRDKFATQSESNTSMIESKTDRDNINYNPDSQGRNYGFQRGIKQANTEIIHEKPNEDSQDQYGESINQSKKKSKIVIPSRSSYSQQGNLINSNESKLLQSSENNREQVKIEENQQKQQEEEHIKRNKPNKIFVNQDQNNNGITLQDYNNNIQSNSQNINYNSSQISQQVLSPLHQKAQMGVLKYEQSINYNDPNRQQQFYENSQNSEYGHINLSQQKQQQQQQQQQQQELPHFSQQQQQQEPLQQSQHNQQQQQSHNNTQQIQSTQNKTQITSPSQYEETGYKHAFFSQYESPQHQMIPSLQNQPISSIKQQQQGNPSPIPQQQQLQWQQPNLNVIEEEDQGQQLPQYNNFQPIQQKQQVQIQPQQQQMQVISNESPVRVKPFQVNNNTSSQQKKDYQSPQKKRNKSKDHSTNKKQQNSAQSNQLTYSQFFQMDPKDKLNYQSMRMSRKQQFQDDEEQEEEQEDQPQIQYPGKSGSKKKKQSNMYYSQKSPYRNSSKKKQRSISPIYFNSSLKLQNNGSNNQGVPSYKFDYYSSSYKQQQAQQIPVIKLDIQIQNQQLKIGVFQKDSPQMVVDKIQKAIKYPITNSKELSKLKQIIEFHINLFSYKYEQKIQFIRENNIQDSPQLIEELMNYLQSKKSEQLYEKSIQNYLIGKITLEVKKKQQLLSVYENDDPFEVALMFLWKKELNISNNMEKLVNLIYDLQVSHLKKLEQHRLKKQFKIAQKQQQQQLQQLSKSQTKKQTEAKKKSRSPLQKQVYQSQKPQQKIVKAPLQSDKKIANKSKSKFKSKERKLENIQQNNNGHSNEQQQQQMVYHSNMDPEKVQHIINNKSRKQNRIVFTTYFQVSQTTQLKVVVREGDQVQDLANSLAVVYNLTKMQHQLLLLQLQKEIKNVIGVI